MMNAKSLKRAFRRIRKTDPFSEKALSLRKFAECMAWEHRDGRRFCPAAIRWLRTKGITERS